MPRSVMNNGSRPEAPAETLTLYIAGPMRGIKNFNFPAFDAAAKFLRSHGWTALSPAEHDRETGFDETLNSLEGFSLAEAFKWDIESIIAADGIVLLPGWGKSSGASLEREIALVLNKRIFELYFVLGEEYGSEEWTIAEVGDE